MTEEELKNKCTERAKIFQQAMESCKSSNPIDCIEWFADRIADLEKENAELKENLEIHKKTVVEMVMPALDRTIKQRTQAIELLKEAQGYIENEDDELYDKIEQFIKEIEK